VIRPDLDEAQWRVWTMTARLVLTRPGVVEEAEALVRAYLGEVEAACSRFRDDSELSVLHRAGGRPARVSPLLAELVSQALAAARRTDGSCDPTVGGRLYELGYDRSIDDLDAGGPVRARVRVRAAADWRQVELRDGMLTVPDGVLLDLGATAKAHAADVCARRLAARLDTGALVSLGGDIATAGAAPDGGWRIRVQDRPGDPLCTVILPGGGAIATSSTVSRRWRRDGATLHHIIDPRTGAPADTVWRTATVAAARCVDANAASTTAVVRGHGAREWLRRTGLPARLVSGDAHVVTVGPWPAAGSRS
jgi:thiamine biosynthesis lipoprotein